MPKANLRTRTIVVMTRVSDAELHVTYCNALLDPVPYLMTVVLRDPPFKHSGLNDADIPAVGCTKAVVST